MLSNPADGVDKPLCRKSISDIIRKLIYDRLPLFVRHFQVDFVIDHDFRVSLRNGHEKQDPCVACRCVDVLRHELLHGALMRALSHDAARHEREPQIRNDGG